MRKYILGGACVLISLLTYSQTKKVDTNLSEHPFVLGSVLQFHSSILNEKRVLNVYLPDGYKSTDTTKYPVIYLLDGSADEDFIHVAGLVQFDNFEWVNRLPKSILIGIANVDRKRDFTYPSKIEEQAKNLPTSGHSDQFINFIAQEVEPLVESKYKVNGMKTIIGESLGGLLATEILIKKPLLFNKYIIISPSLWWDNGSLLNIPLEKLQDIKSSMSIYIGVGKEGLTPGKVTRVMEVDANLLADKLKSYPNKNLKVFFDYLPEENHATISHQAISNAFKVLSN